MAITQKDIEKLSTVFATKEDFKQINQTLEWLVGKVETILQELSIGFSQYQGHDKRLETHETRIVKLEEKVMA